jgi:hypothetical protein
MNQNIKDAAIDVFERFPLAKEVFVTTDEQAFLKEDRARMHDKDFVKVKRSEVMSEEKENEPTKDGKPAKKSAEELIAFAATCELTEELDAILESGEKRATVVAAIAARKEVLTPKQD